MSEVVQKAECLAVMMVEMTDATLVEKSVVLMVEMLDERLMDETTVATRDVGSVERMDVLMAALMAAWKV